MSLDYAADHLLAAVRTVAHSEDPLTVRLQTAWDQSVQRVWEKPCLTRDLLIEFKALWERYTAPTTDPRSTKLREMTVSEAAAAIDDLLALSVRTAVTGGRAGADVKLATLADLR
jgi:hypothetical protein